MSINNSQWSLVTSSNFEAAFKYPNKKQRKVIINSRHELPNVSVIWPPTPKRQMVAVISQKSCHAEL